MYSDRCWCRRGVVSCRRHRTCLGPSASMWSLAGTQRSAAAAAGDGVGQLHVQHHRQPARLRCTFSLLHWVSWRGFSVITSQTRTYLDETWNVTEGPRCALTQEKWGNRPHGFRLRLSKYKKTYFVMAALWNRAGHIYFHPVVSSYGRPM